ncbi:DUF6770 family protein [Chitinophaga rhizophila]|uniref:Uncharacterized protein n=1 Tax=Chitinophaga rhizophila TaxID=2866212 RepID=A0ABS7G6E1_9BACT|nr:DUF6770 family protein [Chitinophaga rhizophila]MBW8682936.1 hypothetical protein [Chitinophaga rhizophila]
MKKLFTTIIPFIAFLCCAKAQTKVFREVSDAISTEFKTITQNGALIGYLSFTELERASKDSFNYTITIMDENLNDLGVVKFKELKLDLQSVSFVNDTLCLAYMKSNVLGYDWKSRAERKEALDKGYVAVFAQFISLDGKIAHTFEKKLNTDVQAAWEKIKDGKIGNALIEHPLQMQNVDQKGFCVFYGDKDHVTLLVLTTQAELLWEKYVLERGGQYYMLTSGRDVYLLLRNQTDPMFNNYTVISYNTDTKTGILKYQLQDFERNRLRVVAFDNDPATGKPFISGYIHHTMGINKYQTYKGIEQHMYQGMFTININGHEKSAVKRLFNYWTENVEAGGPGSDFLETTNGFLNEVTAFRDYHGNTYLTGYNTMRMSKWGSVVLIKQDPAKKTAVSHLFAQTRLEAITDNMPYVNRFYSVVSPDTKSTYLIINDKSNTFIYSLDKGKVMRTISRRDGNNRLHIFPAKEGHLMIAEYNKKDKSTTLSIESI